MEDRPWLAHYDAGVPHTLAPYPERTLLDYLDDAVRGRPNSPFLWFKGRQFSWLDINQLSDRFASALVTEGVRQGDRVAVVLPNCPQMVIAELGIWKAGAISVPLNPLYTEEELERASAHVGAKIAVVLTLSYARMKKVQPRTALRRIIATNIKEYLPRHLALLFSLAKEKKDGHRITLAEQDAWFADLLRDAPTAGSRAKIGCDDTAMLLFSGGTTGTPKAAIIRHQALVIAAMQFCAWGPNVLRAWESVGVLTMPLFHIYGTWLLAAAIQGHYTFALVPNPRDLDDVLATIRRTHAVYLPAVPTLLTALLEHPRVRAGKRDVQSIQVCGCAAAPLMQETRRRWQEATGVNVTEGYALTESCAGATINPVHGQQKPRWEFRYPTLRSGSWMLILAVKICRRERWARSSCARRR